MVNGRWQKQNGPTMEKSSNMNTDEYAEDILGQMFLQARAQFGSAVKSFWFYGGDSCPGCRRKVDFMKVKGKDALSVNGFMYRKRGVLIGYILCGRCAKAIFRDAKRNPGQETARHMVIELSLINGYHKYMNSLDS